MSGLKAQLNAARDRIHQVPPAQHNRVPQEATTCAMQRAAEYTPAQCNRQRRAAAVGSASSLHARAISLCSICGVHEGLGGCMGSTQMACAASAWHPLSSAWQLQNELSLTEARHLQEVLPSPCSS